MNIFQGRPKYDATNIMWVEYWVSKVDLNNKYAAIHLYSGKQVAGVCSFL